jgi:carbohydrate-selective porin OprB
MTGLQWADVFAKGNAAGIAVGQPSNTDNASKATMLEFFYKYQVSNNISVTPAIFYVSDNQGSQNASSNWGGVIQTTFRF